MNDYKFRDFAVKIDLTTNKVMRYWLYVEPTISYNVRRTLYAAVDRTTKIFRSLRFWSTIKCRTIAFSRDEDYTIRSVRQRRSYDEMKLLFVKENEWFEKNVAQCYRVICHTTKNVVRQ